MVREISGDEGSTPRIGPQERKMYEQEYKHSADLFQRALKEHSASDNIFQREEFKQVMDKAMMVLNETARELKRQELLKQNKQIEKDYGAYQNNQNEMIVQKLDEDLDKAKKSI
jgi:hypothetical protein